MHLQIINRDDRGEHEGAVSATPGTYRALIVQFRKHQLKATENWLKRMESLFDKAVQDILNRIDTVDAEDWQKGADYTYVADLQDILNNFRADYAAHLNISTVDLAQLAADRELAIERKFGKPIDPRLSRTMQASYQLSSGAELHAQFGQVALQAVQNTAGRVLSDGWKLSDRLYNMDAKMRAVVQDAIVKGVMESKTPAQVASDLRPLLVQSGADNPRYQAMRIARTEIVTSHREAHILSTIDPVTEQQKEYIAGVGWALSLSHPEPDICDVWAADDEHGLGPGVYLSSDVPTDHPHGLCWTYTVIKGVEIDPPAKKPDTEAVPASQPTYYAEKQDDPASKRWVAANGDSENE